jgi:hypothetical protein
LLVELVAKATEDKQALHVVGWPTGIRVLSSHTAAAKLGFLTAPGPRLGGTWSLSTRWGGVAIEN